MSRSPEPPVFTWSSGASDDGRGSVYRSLLGLCVVAWFASMGQGRVATITVPSGADLQSVLTHARPGDTILLEAGATYVGNFTLPNNSGTDVITVQTASTGLPGDGERISPAFAPRLAKLRSPNSDPAMRTMPGAHHWRLQLIEFPASADGDGEILRLGDGSSAQFSLAQVAHDLRVDRCYIHGDPGKPQKRGIALNSASTTVTGSYVAEIKAVGQDSQAIAGWNGPGPFTITNNYLEAAGENIMFGGADPAIPSLVPSDITIANNQVIKQIGWRAMSWQVKNLLELKNASRVTIRDNTFDYNWQAAQPGFAILFTVRNQDGGCPWCRVERVTFQGNAVRHSAGGVSILGMDDAHPSGQTQSIIIRNNTFADIDNAHWGGSGYFLQLLDAPRDVIVDHNTIVQDHAYGILTMDGPPISGVSVTNNLARRNAYGIIGRDHAPGNDSIAAYLPASVFRSNVIADADAAEYPRDNVFPTSDQFRAQFVSYNDGDYRLVANSAWRKAGTDGADLGAPASVAAATPPSLPFAPVLDVRWGLQRLLDDQFR